MTQITEMGFIIVTNQAAAVLFFLFKPTIGDCKNLNRYFRKNDRRKLAVKLTVMHIVLLARLSMKNAMHHKDTLSLHHRKIIAFMTSESSVLSEMLCILTVLKESHINNTYCPFDFF